LKSSAERGGKEEERNLSISSGPEKGCHSELGLIPMLTNGIKMGGDHLDQCCKMEKKVDAFGDLASNFTIK